MGEEFGTGTGSEDLSRAQVMVLDDVYLWLVQHDRWPTYEEIDHDADRHGIEDPLSVIQSLTPKLLQGASGIPGPQQEVSLSLVGVATVARWSQVARDDLELFTKSVQQAVLIADRTRPPASANFSAMAFMSTLRPGAGIPVKEVLRLERLWNAGGGGLWQGLHGIGTIEWGATLNRQNIRRYRQVQDVASLLEVESRRSTLLHSHDPATNGPSMPLAPRAAAITSPAGMAPAWVLLLPDGLREAIGAKVVHSGPDAINAGWIALADLIHEKVGLDLDGEDLVNQAFGGKKPRMRLGPETKTGENLHQAYTHLMRALARVRNAQSHRGRPEVTDLHVAATVLAMGECFEVISKCNPEHPSSA
ncbi:TIGR02391 family protein [Nocardioides plantarum]|uniref:TIGR02391 family protein n=1 Tax=Nocardioides plantarum TaxID=29299 RepID=A0ABV5KID4_9ACTN|nr:TIGR02391 family protein [Nocardioides plantarum]